MDAEFWHERWALGEIGFHRSAPHWALEAHWSVVSGNHKDASVLVPLCGKSNDLHWLRGHHTQITGLELSRSAIEAFIADWPAKQRPDVVWQPANENGHERVALGNLELIVGDFFTWTAPKPYELFYDRAALIALPQTLRGRYLAHLHGQLIPGARGLLVTFEYVQKQMDGPPFSVSDEELRAQPGWQVDCLERRNVWADHPGMQAKGLTALVECVYRMERL